MKLNWNYRLGGRAYKTAAAVLITSLISLLLKRSAFYGCIASVICMQKSVEETQVKGRQRLEGTAVGGIMGWIFLEAAIRIPHYQDFVFAMLAPIGVLVVIYVLNVLNKCPSVMIGCVVFLSIVVSFNRTLAEIPWYVINRVLDTALGIGVAAIINWMPNKKSCH